MQAGYDIIRIVNMEGEFLGNAIRWLGGKVAQTNSVWVHSDSVHGDPASLSDARLTHKSRPLLAHRPSACSHISRVVAKVNGMRGGRRSLC